jgi:hypothetical protein
MVGEGELADQIKTMFRVFRQKYALDAKMPPLGCGKFVAPQSASGQLQLF